MMAHNTTVQLGGTAFLVCKVAGVDRVGVYLLFDYLVLFCCMCCLILITFSTFIGKFRLNLNDIDTNYRSNKLKM